METMTIKEEIMHGLERLAATLPSKKVTVILCCESKTPEPPIIYEVSKSGMRVTVMTTVTNKNNINNLLVRSFNEAKALFYPKHYDTEHEPS